MSTQGAASVTTLAGLSMSDAMMRVEIGCCMNVN